MSRSGASSSYMCRCSQPKTVFSRRHATNDQNFDIYILEDAGVDFSDNGSDEENDESKNIIDKNNHAVSNFSGQNGTTHKLLKATNNFGKNKNGFGDSGDDAQLDNQSSAASALVPYGNEEDQTTTSSASKRESFPDTDHDEVETSRGLKDRPDVALARRSVDPPRNKSEVKKHEHNFLIKNTQNDKSEETVTFNWYNILTGVISITIFCFDIGTDINLAARYFREGLWNYGAATTALIVIPSLIICFLGLHWYLIDYKKEQKFKKENRKAYTVPGYVWFLRILFTLLMCGPIVRNVEYLYYGYNSQNKKLSTRERKRFQRLMMYEDVDSCLLGLFESFLESAPQLILQLYIANELIQQGDIVGSSGRAIVLLSSWGSLAVSHTSYQRSLRSSNDEKAKMSIISLPFYFIWRASEIGGRVLCIAMFASAFDLWVFGPLIFHWVLMSSWLVVQNTTFYKNVCLEKVFNIICGYVMVFCFLNLRDGQTRFRVILFYFSVYVENFLMLALWFKFTKDVGGWLHQWGLIVVLILFVFHVVFQLLYYWFFHPTKNIKMCLPCDRFVLYSSICHDLQPHDDKSAEVNHTVAEIIVDEPKPANVKNQDLVSQV
ncbi:XK-related protein 6-like [Physella acuta]|uniref:XK-related protein 6-like n=1 Tax=Physella acuta TaxID=109671 RepID=UPI0027DE8914|nr:XK-related protein 6-like [Physella acuta]XP_059151771.1 XK-related protein 6-like [Physella acuta]